MQFVAFHESQISVELFLQKSKVSFFALTPIEVVRDCQDNATAMDVNAN